MPLSHPKTPAKISKNHIPDSTIGTKMVHIAMESILGVQMTEKKSSGFHMISPSKELMFAPLFGVFCGKKQKAASRKAAAWT